MIVIKIQGGLGNQMFQYAAGLSAAHKLNTNLKMDLSWFDNLKEADTPRFCELANFSLQQDFITGSQYYFADDSLKNRLFSAGKARLIKYTEPHFQYDNNLEKIKNNTYLEGYFQTEEYFKSMAFARILGYLVTDGHIKNTGCEGYIFLGHKLDVERIIEDIKIYSHFVYAYLD